MPMLHFTKMNGAGNDFVLLDNRDRALRLDGQMIARLCDRHRGIGADGVLVVEPAENGADFRMRYYNSDGGEAEMCGNGARCFARFTRRLSGGGDTVSFETIAGPIHAFLEGETIRLNMSTPRDLRLHQTIEAAGENLTVHSVDTGVPHAVVQMADLDNVDVQAVGSALRYHPHFAPKGTNVNFVETSAHGAAHRIRTYERGVEGETLACGTGVVAAAIILHEVAGASVPVRLVVKGGDTLEVSFTKTDAGYTEVLLSGPADFVFDGVVEL